MNEVPTGHIKFDFGARMIPHPEKAHKGGEDAYFSNEKLLVVCDGVGGWATQGIDPADYSRGLAKNVEKNFFKSKEPENLKDVLILANEQTKVVGSSTCVFAAIDPKEEIVNTCNLGDSSYLWLRKSGDDLIK